MSDRTYYMDDCTIPVPAGFQDRTAHLLEWQTTEEDKIALLVQRDPLPAAGADDAQRGEALKRYVAAQTAGYAAQFAGFHLELDEVASGEGGFPIRRKAFRWQKDQAVLYHHQVFVLAGDVVILFTGAAKAIHRAAVDDLLHEAVSNLHVRGD